MLNLGHALPDVLESGLIPTEVRDFVRCEIEREEAIVLRPVRTIEADRTRPDWFAAQDRSSWYYWPALREYLLTTKNWPLNVVRSIDDSSDRVVRLLSAPSEPTFDIRGLVLGYVQSGKTANYTAVCAKAADAGYRLVIVLSGIDKGLRRQTNVRLKKELVGVADGRNLAVRLPPVGRQWHEFTRPEMDGDFNPGLANHAALQGSQPVLLVVKKNGPVLRRLLRWLDEAPQEILQSIPALVIDDEADLASVDTRGGYQSEDGPADENIEPPSIINGLIRQLLERFSRRSYVAYTATPFANILIPHDATNAAVGSDLYPKDFIVDLPRPDGYYGAEEIFGRPSSTGDESSGLDCIRLVSDVSLVQLEAGGVPEELKQAMVDFVLAGAARASRLGRDEPATMLIHTSHLIAFQAPLTLHVAQHFAELRDEWRYQRSHGVRERLRQRWELEFRPVTRASHLTRDVPFEGIEEEIGPFLEATQVREVNSARGDVLDYDREPGLKAIAVGGNRLSRGLTLEGLLISFFVRRSPTYDTLMQMGRWFGFRDRYEDLTRIYTTSELAGWFADLALVEARLRDDIKVYEEQGLTPYQVGLRIWQHPAMQVTSPLKRRFTSSTVVSQSYRLSLEQTFRFPLSRPSDLAQQADANVELVRQLARTLGEPDKELTSARGPVWAGVPARIVLDFLRRYKIDDRVRGFSLPLVTAYIERCVAEGELGLWTVAVCGLAKSNPRLGVADWGLPGGPVSLVGRSRLSIVDSIGALVDPADEAIGLSTDLRGIDARRTRPPTEGLLLVYPISRNSGHDLGPGSNRKPLFDDPEGPLARDLVGIALSLPESNAEHSVEEYIRGTAPGLVEVEPEWLPEE